MSSCRGNGQKCTLIKAGKRWHLPNSDRPGGKQRMASGPRPASRSCGRGGRRRVHPLSRPPCLEPSVRHRLAYTTAVILPVSTPGCAARGRLHPRPRTEREPRPEAGGLGRAAGRGRRGQGLAPETLRAVGPALRASQSRPTGSRLPPSAVPALTALTALTPDRGSAGCA